MSAMRVTWAGGKIEVAKRVLSRPELSSPWEVYPIRRRLHMGMAVAIVLALFVAIFLLFLPLVMSGKQWRAAQDRARARRMAEHRMNARLLRLNI
jgi:hypothetical protein